MLPFQDNIFKQFDIGTLYVIYYRKVEARLLPCGYDPHCINYDLDYKHGNFNIQSDCIYSCIIDRVGKSCIADIKTYMQILLKESQLEIQPDNNSECNRTNEIGQAKNICHDQMSTRMSAIILYTRSSNDRKEG